MTTTRTRRARLLVALALLLGLPAGRAAPAADERTVGAPVCAECHLQEIEALKLSRHFKTYREMHKRPETEAMLGRLGLGGIKTEARCASCHYLTRVVDGQAQAVGGISCESCHGPGRDYARTHGDYGKGVKKEDEPAAHRTARWEQAKAAGLVRPGDLYTLAGRCYSCHVLADEAVVNEGGHSAANPKFSLLTWSQGEVRHTILHTGNKANPEATPARRRQLFVVGAILDLEHGLRAVAQATVKSTFGVTLAHRTDAARRLLRQVQQLAPAPELADIVAAADAARLRLHNAAQLVATADRVAALGRQFAAREDGSGLAAIDGLLPGPDQYQGRPYQVAGSP